MSLDVAAVLQAPPHSVACGGRQLTRGRRRRRRHSPPPAPACAGPNGCGKSSLLDALCFAFAAPLKSFSVASLADLANSDSSEVRCGWDQVPRGRLPAGSPHQCQRRLLRHAMQVCEVCVHLRRSTSTAAESHTVAAALTPDGSRVFRVDGRWVLRRARQPSPSLASCCNGAQASAPPGCCAPLAML